MSYILKAIKGELGKGQTIPIWFMRQAGRYLPEYQMIRRNYKNFLDFCYSEKDAAEVTIQPLRRFDLDAAIIFSDILVIPDMMGFDVKFSEGYGPSIDLENSKVQNGFDNKKLDHLIASINITKASLADFKDKDFIGFVGAPLTLAYYILQKNKELREQTILEEIASSSNRLTEIIEQLENMCAQFLITQYQAGVTVLKIFDSHAGILRNREDLIEYSVKPIHNIIKKVRAKIPQAAIIIFPRGVAENINLYKQITDMGNIALALSEEAKIGKIREHYKCALQGNISNNIFFADDTTLRNEAHRLMSEIDRTSHIVNLGHGILPQTNPDKVKLLIDEIRKYQ